MSSPTDLTDDAYCFICGKANEQGLRLEWTTRENKTESKWLPKKSFQGWKGIVHGGILAALLDEAMTRLAWQIHGDAVTAEITVRFVSPARIDEPLLIQGDVEEARGRLIPAKSEIRTQDGRLIATAVGKVLKTSQ
jgi:uncharacterized protein (TIGR00369 family)